MSVTQDSRVPARQWYLLAVGIIAVLAVLDLLGVFEVVGPGRPF